MFPRLGLCITGCGKQVTRPTGPGRRTRPQDRCRCPPHRHPRARCRQPARVREVQGQVLMADAASFDDQQRGRSDLHPLPVAPPVPVEPPPTRRRSRGDGWRTHSACRSAHSAHPDHPGTRSSELMTSTPGAAARFPAKKPFPAPEWPSTTPTWHRSLPSIRREEGVSARGVRGPGSRHETCPPRTSGHRRHLQPEQAADFIGRLVRSGATAIAVERLRRDPRQQEEPMTEHLLPLVT